MKIIYINSYSGHLKKPPFEFLAKESTDADFVCLQEVSVSLQKELEDLLKEFSSVFEIGFLLSDCNELAGQAVFYKKDIKFLSSEKVLLHELKTKDIGFYLKTKFEIDGKTILIGNVHGTAQPGDKLDSDTRLSQSRLIIDSSNDNADYKIVGGDFNLLRTTKSIQVFENSGYENLIEKFGIKATRNSVAWERFKDDPNFVKQYDSDYIFTKNIIAKNLLVPDMSISDHNPLILEFEIEGDDIISFR